MAFGRRVEEITYCVVDEFSGEKKERAFNNNNNENAFFSSPRHVRSVLINSKALGELTYFFNSSSSYKNISYVKSYLYLFR